MGTRGPVPKRSDAVMGHRTKAELGERELAPSGTRAPLPVPDADPQWHPIAREWFESLGESGQHRFFEASDWATARYVAEAMHRHLSGGTFGAQMFAAIMSAASELMSTEGSRRRLRLELQRAGDDAPAEPPGITAINEYRKRISG
jgi:hypothetical protein